MDPEVLRQAARLWGAAAALRDEAGAALPPEQRPLHESGMAVVQPLLGEAAYAQAEQEGRAMTAEEITDLLSGRLVAASLPG